MLLAVGYNSECGILIGVFCEGLGTVLAVLSFTTWHELPIDQSTEKMVEPIVPE
jgi:hypothetical protein